MAIGRSNVSKPVATEKTSMEKFFPVLIVLLVVMAFGLGSMWSKLKYLESGGTSGKGNTGSGAGNAAEPAPAGKYKTLVEAMTAYGKQVGLDTDKMVKCVEEGSKVAQVEADYQQGLKLGVQGTPAFFVNGKFLGGSFPFSSFKELIDRELDGTGSKVYTDYKESNLLGAGAGSDPAFIPNPKNVELGTAAIRGNKTAKVTVIEFSDFQCPYCSRGFTTVKQIMDTYGDKVKVVFKNFPLRQIHPLAQKTAEYFECTRDQGEEKSWNFHDVIFTNQAEWSSVTL